MQSVVHLVRDLGATERTAVERLLGHGLDENQRFVIQVMDIDSQSPANSKQQIEDLPPWCNVYEGLSDERIAEIERSIVRTSGTRSVM